MHFNNHGVCIYSALQIVALQKVGMSRFQTGVTHFVRGISVLMIPIAATVPSVSKQQCGLNLI